MGTLSLKSHISPNKKIESETPPPLNGDGLSEEKPKNILDVHKTAKWLSKTYPNLFLKTHGKAISLGTDRLIFNDQGDQLPTTKIILRKAISMYVHHPSYLETVLSSDQRYNLNGDPCGTIDPDHKRQTQERIEEREKKKADQE